MTGPQLGQGVAIPALRTSARTLLQLAYLASRGHDPDRVACLVAAADALLDLEPTSSESCLRFRTACQLARRRILEGTVAAAGLWSPSTMGAAGRTVTGAGNDR